MFHRSFRALALGATLLTPGLAAADTLNVQYMGDIRSSQPGVKRDSMSDSVVLNVVEGLVAIGEGGAVIPMLAEGWEVSDDGTRYTFRLREGVPFHNGAVLTAEDAKWSIETLLANPDYNCRVFFDGSRQAKLETIEVTGPLELVITLSNPDAMFLTYMARGQCGSTAIVHRDSYAADGAWIKPVGTGPFVFDEWRQGQSIRLTKFGNYEPLAGGIDGYGGTKEALVDDVVFHVVPDVSTAIAALRSGVVDVIPFLPSSEAPEILTDPDYTVVTGGHGGLITILFQTRDALMSNVDMRRAVIAAIDTEMLLENITGGLGTPNHSLVPTTSMYHTELHERGYEYDPAAVPALLEKAGYAGETFVLLTNRRNKLNYEAAVIAQAMLEGAGIKAEIQVLEWASQLDLYYSGAYQSMAFNFSNQVDPGLIYRNIIGDKDARANSIWENAEANALADEVLQTVDPAARQVVFDRLHEMFLDEVPMIMLANGFDVGVSRKNVQGYATWQGFARLWGVSVER